MTGQGLGVEFAGHLEGLLCLLRIPAELEGQYPAHHVGLGILRLELQGLLYRGPRQAVGLAGRQPTVQSHDSVGFSQS